MNYRIVFTPESFSQLAALPQNAQRQIKKKIDLLHSNPRPKQSKQLEKNKHLYRLRSGDYRIIYQIEDDLLLILLVRIGHRKEAYRRLPKSLNPIDQ